MSTKKLAQRVLKVLPVSPAKGNVVDAICHRLNVDSQASQAAVNYLLENNLVAFDGSYRLPTALRAKA